MNPISPLVTSTVRTVLIDGPSGSGKTTMARNLAVEQRMQLIHLDDFYPGWYGLAAARNLVAELVLHPTNPRFQRWDWEHGKPGEWVFLEPGCPRIIEGVGAVSAQSIESALALGDVIAVKVEANVEVRRARALHRDPDFAPWWDVWQQQEVEHFAEFPEVDLVLYR
ncbi:(d)CMP kinase [Staphylococcus chromogenes]|nr:(d)CMP kinase [Staphylococcus chromogenes]